MDSTSIPSGSYRGNILVVDDTIDSLRLLVNILMEHGYQVRPATNGRWALATARVNPPDIILLDIIMPDMDGFAVCAALKADVSTRHIPIIFISALHEVFDKVRAFSIGGVDYITKPFQIEEMLVRIHTHLTIRRAQEALRQSEARYRAVVEDQTELICRFQPDGTISFANDACCRFFNCSANELTNYGFLHYLYRSHQVSADRSGLPFSPNTPIQTSIDKVPNSQGHVRWLQWTTRAIFAPSGQLVEFQAVGRDITAQYQAEEKVRQVNNHLAHAVVEQETLNRMSSALQRCQTLEEAYAVSVPFLRNLFGKQIGVFYRTFADTSRLELVDQWGSFLAIPPTQMQNDCPVLTNPPARLVTYADPDTQCTPCVNEKKQPMICIHLSTEDEQFGLLHLREKPDMLQSSYDHWSRLATITADMLVLALSNLRLREKLHDQAIRDPLTGIFNRRFLDEILVQRICQATRHQRTLSILLIDIDHFKQINDTYGHDAGDTVLRNLGHVLLAGVRMEDTVCRYGGEEFVLVVNEISLENASLRADALRQEIQAMQIEHAGMVLPSITVSIGMALFPEHGETPAMLIAAADHALYEAKASGRNRVCVAIASSTT